MLNQENGGKGMEQKIMNQKIMDIISQMTLEEKAGMCSGADYWHTKSVERLKIPRIMMCDGPHGLRKQAGEGDHMGIRESIEAVCFPTASALAASFDRELLEELGATLGEECQEEQIGMLLGPGLNIKRSPLCGRNFEYFSEDPYLAGELGSSYIQGLQGKGIAACIKHFACNNQETRRMSSTSQVDERTLHEIYLPAFEQAVKKGKCRGVMCSYNQVNGVYASKNRELLTDILRKRWGFEGLVVTDWGAVKDRVKGLEAGLDLEMPGGAGVQDDKIITAVKTGELDEAVLDCAVYNILKFVMEAADLRKSSGSLGSADWLPKDREKAEMMAGECAVLLKNDNKILPIPMDADVAFIGAFAERPRYQGAGSSHVNVREVSSPLKAAEGLFITYAEGYKTDRTETDEELLEEAVRKAAAAKVAVIFAGLTEALETEGADRKSLKLPENQNQLIEAVSEVQPDIVVVLHGGAPVEMPWESRVSAILNMYLGGERVGAAEKAILFGEISPSGKLAETYPLKASDNPSWLNFPGEDGVVEYKEGIYAGYRYYDKKEMEVLFPFGHGLSYTEFSYSGLRLDKETMKDTEALRVSCRIKNTGSIPGKEVLQLYVRDKESTVGRPVRELKGFTKVLLAPGEEKEVVFELDRRSFAYYEPKIHDWFVESGIYIIEVGASSRDIRLSAEVMVEGIMVLPRIITKETIMGDVIDLPGFKAIIDGIIKKKKDQAEKGGEDISNLGEGSAQRVQNMMLEMPLSKLVTFGRMTEAQLDSLLADLNLNQTR